MINAPIPCFNYSRTALFTDDDQRHLTRISMELDDRLAYSVFSNPKKVLDYIQTHGRPKKLLQIETLYLEIQNPNRSHEPSLLVTDYTMEGTGMNGIDLCIQVKQLCEKLNVTPPKMILLSGQATEDIAQESLKKQYIDRYISKLAPRCGYLLDQAIRELQQQFSIEQSMPIFQILSTYPNFCLQDPLFVGAFQQICRDYDVEEYFILNSEGDFLLSQFDGSLLWLVVIPESQEKTSTKKTYAPSFQKIKGTNENFYYSVIKEPDLMPIDRKKIISHQHYL